MKKNSKDIFAKYAESAAIKTSGTDPEGRTEMIQTDQIDENPENSKIFSMDKVSDLARDIKERGFVGAIYVYKKDDGRYEVISGHQRLRAAKSVGMTKIRCFIKEYDKSTQKADILRDLISSNINNREITAMEKSNAVYAYCENVLDNTLTKEARIAKACDYFGMSRSNITTLLGLQNLNPKLKEYAMMNGFPVRGFEGTLRMSDESIDRLCDMIESYPGFKQYREQNESCPLSTRLLKGLVKQVSESKSVREPDKPYNKYLSRVMSFRNDIVKRSDISYIEFKSMYNEINNTLSALDAYMSLINGDKTDVNDSLLPYLSKEQIKNLENFCSDNRALIEKLQKKESR